jgi:hypothetical protein
MVLDYDGLVRYYYDVVLAPVDKATGNVLTNGSVNFFDRRALPAVLRYCFSGGWDSTGATAPTLASVQSTMATATADWARVVNARFIYVSSLDGTTCNSSQVTAGAINFWVTQHPTANTADAPFPSVTASFQRLRVGRGAATNGILRHELGHVLGLRHEQVHPNSGLGCASEGNVQNLLPGLSQVGPAALTGYDAASVMHYTNGGIASCSGGTTSTKAISPLDGVGTRILYGPPVAWQAASIF